MISIRCCCALNLWTGCYSILDRHWQIGYHLHFLYYPVICMALLLCEREAVKCHDGHYIVDQNRNCRGQAIRVFFLIISLNRYQTALLEFKEAFSTSKTMSGRDTELMPPPSLVLRARHDASVDDGSTTPPEVPRKDGSIPPVTLTPRKIEKSIYIFPVLSIGTLLN